MCSKKTYTQTATTKDSDVIMGVLQDHKYVTPIQKGTVHAPSIFLKKNAKFLIDSSRKIKGFNSNILEKMAEAYSKNEYSTVLDLALMHDGKCRPVKRIEKNPAQILWNQIYNQNSWNTIMNTMIEKLDKNLDTTTQDLFNVNAKKMTTADRLVKIRKQIQERVQVEFHQKSETLKLNTKNVLEHCEQAFKLLSRDLTYGDRAQARKAIEEAIKLLKKR